jgi:hypothetical protein
MRVFLSWSGQRSLTVASVLRDWLPLVLQGCQPWLSSDDVRKGSRWQVEVGDALQEPLAGILCLTRDNIASPWLVFEAGAISKAIRGTSFVCTYLIDVDNADVPLPLGMFQSTAATRSETLKLLRDLNDLMTPPVPADRLGKLFDTFWTDLEVAISTARSMPVGATQSRDASDILQEILETVRGLAARTTREQGKRPASAISSVTWVRRMARRRVLCSSAWTHCAIDKRSMI